MRKSKLEAYECILETLVNKPLTIEHIAYEANLDCTILKQQLEFLTKNDLIELRTFGEKTSYAITERGTAVLRALNFQKYLGKIKNKVRAIDEALQIIPDMAERNYDYDRKNES